MIWYPYEQMKTMKAPYKIEDANGVYLYTKDQKLIDSVSSWWCMIHGLSLIHIYPAVGQARRRGAPPADPDQLSGQPGVSGLSGGLSLIHI